MRKNPFEAARVTGVAAAAVLAICLGAAPVSADSHEARLADVEVGRGAIKWVPLHEHANLVLTVSGPSLDARHEFDADESPVFSVESKRHGRLLDGAYSWELRAAPKVSPELREQMMVAREAKDHGLKVDMRGLRPEARGPLEQSGHFTIVDGVIAGPGEKEPERQKEQTGDVEVEGDLKVRGAKSFVATDPSDGRRQLVYAALEGPEAGTYHRGASRTVAGEVAIELPGHFASVTESEGLTVQLTPVGGWSRLYVAEKSLRHLVVRSADGDDVAFDYLVQGIRKGFADFEVEREPSAEGVDFDSEGR